MKTSTAYVNTLENGEIQRPRKNTLLRLAKALATDHTTSTEIYTEFLKIVEYDTKPTQVRSIANEVADFENNHNNNLDHMLLSMPWKTTVHWATCLIGQLEKSNINIERKMHYVKSRNLKDRYNLNDFKIQKSLNQILINHLRYVKQLQENRR